MSATATAIDVVNGLAQWCVVEGDSLAVLTRIESRAVDAVITDPPYSSGGQFRGDRMVSTDMKYTKTQHQGARPDFDGDNRDQRAFGYWCALWLSEALRCAGQDARLAVFTDWRQLSMTIDAIQAGGWLYRGIAPWDKGDGARPLAGGIRAQCEYVVWGSNGPIKRGDREATLPGCFRYAVRRSDKHHQAGKPTALMRDLVMLANPGGVVLDPFAGSGTTGVAAIHQGRRAILVERNAEYAEIARQRCLAAESSSDFTVPEQSPLFTATAGAEA